MRRGEGRVAPTGSTAVASRQGNRCDDREEWNPLTEWKHVEIPWARVKISKEDLARFTRKRNVKGLHLGDRAVSVFDQPNRRRPGQRLAAGHPAHEDRFGERTAFRGRRAASGLTRVCLPTALWLS